jgi:hypothetical protein
MTWMFTFVFNEAALSVTTYLIDVNWDCLIDVYVLEYIVFTCPLSNFH